MEELNKELVEYYKTLYNTGTLGWQEDFCSVVQTLESKISGKCDDPQKLIDSLTEEPKNMSEGLKKRYSLDPAALQFLTAIVQALYNLNYGDEFVIDIRGWPKDEYLGMFFLRGCPDRPLTLKLHGNFREVGRLGEYTNFIISGNIEHCGFFSKNSMFSLMPDSAIENYLGHKSNVIRLVNEKGAVKDISLIQRGEVK